MIRTFHKIRRKVIVRGLFRRKVEPSNSHEHLLPSVQYLSVSLAKRLKCAAESKKKRDEKKSSCKGTARLWLSRHVLTLTVWTKLELSAANEVSGLIRPYEKLGHGVRKGGNRNILLFQALFKVNRCILDVRMVLKRFVTSSFPVSFSFSHYRSLTHIHIQGHMQYSVVKKSNFNEQ